MVNLDAPETRSQADGRTESRRTNHSISVGDGCEAEHRELRSGRWRSSRVGGGFGWRRGARHGARVSKMSLNSLRPRGVRVLARSAGSEARTPREPWSWGRFVPPAVGCRCVWPCPVGGWTRSVWPRAGAPDVIGGSESHISDRFACKTAQWRARKTRLGRSTAGGWGTTRSAKPRPPLGCCPGVFDPLTCPGTLHPSRSAKRTWRSGTRASAPYRRQSPLIQPSAPDRATRSRTLHRPTQAAGEP